jgi:hypothetical protein
MAENSGEKQPRRGPGRPFQKGRSGNPAGKPRGARHRITVLAETLLAKDAGNVVRVVVDAAKGGDMAACRLVLDRVLPPRKGRPVRFSLPPIATAADLVSALGAVLGGVAGGELTPDEAAAIGGLIEANRKALEIVELDARVAALERQRG